MSTHIGYGLVSLPAPHGPLVDALNNGGLRASPVTVTAPGWFCWGCRQVAPQSVGVMVFSRDHAKCGGGET